MSADEKQTPVVVGARVNTLVEAMNSLNTPWVAIFVILLGMCFDILCKVWGVPNDAATGVIGAGIGLLTGQALSRPTQPGIAPGKE